METNAAKINRLTPFDRLLAAGASTRPQPGNPRLFSESHRNTEAKPGQIWRTMPSSPDEEKTLSHWVLVVSRDLLQDTPLYRVAPMFTEAAMADQQDGILPREVLGFEAAFALGLTVSTTPESLDCCVLTLPDPWTNRLLELDRCVRTRSILNTGELESGVPYIDELDSRIGFHAELLQELDYLQAPTACFLSEDASGLSRVLVIDFWDPLQDALANSGLATAAKTPAALDEKMPSKRFFSSYAVEGTNSSIRLEANNLDPELQVVVISSTGLPSRDLDGFSLKTETGATFVFDGAKAYVPLEGFTGRLQLISSTGEPVALTPLPPPIA